MMKVTLLDPASKIPWEPPSMEQVEAYATIHSAMRHSPGVSILVEYFPEPLPSAAAFTRGLQNFCEPSRFHWITVRREGDGYVVLWSPDQERP